MCFHLTKSSATTCASGFSTDERIWQPHFGFFCVCSKLDGELDLIKGWYVFAVAHCGLFCSQLQDFHSWHLNIRPVGTLRPKGFLVFQFFSKLIEGKSVCHEIFLSRDVLHSCQSPFCHSDLENFSSKQLPPLAFVTTRLRRINYD